MWRREEVVQQLQKKQGRQSLRSFASSLGCSPAYLSDVYRGRRDPGPKLLEDLGLERQVKTEVVYVKRRWR